MPESEPQTATNRPTDSPEFAGEYDAERAGRLITTLRAEVKALKAELAAAKTESASHSGALTAAEERATAAERALYIDRARRAHNLPETVVEFLTGDTEKEITAKAERLASLGQPDPSEPQPVPVVTRPEPALVPAHGGEQSAPFAPHAVAEAARTIGAR